MTDVPRPRADEVDFAHNSERQFALLLDFYDIEWHYEPRSFPIAWTKDGEPQQFFTPDFYLPEDDIYIEITTMNQKLVTKKNRKARMLRERYPDVKCKVLYQRDYMAMVAKYGFEGPAQLEDIPTPSRIPGVPIITKLDDRGSLAG